MSCLTRFEFDNTHRQLNTSKETSEQPEKVRSGGGFSLLNIITNGSPDGTLKNK